MLVLLTALFLTAPPGAGKMTADLLVTNQPGTVVLRWRQGQPLTFENVKTARRGEPMAAFILFTNCRPDKQGQCDVRAEMSVIDPLQKVYGESKDTEVWVGKPAPTAGRSQLGVGYMMIVIEPGDPPGQYRVKAHVTDRVAGTALDPEWSFEVPTLRATDSAAVPADRPRAKLSGFWKDHCEDDFGLKIEPAGGDLYSISFCGPGGCFEPGTYRPNSAIYGDESYRVLDSDTLEVLGGDGFSKYFRCAAAPAR